MPLIKYPIDHPPAYPHHDVKIGINNMILNTLPLIVAVVGVVVGGVFAFLQYRHGMRMLRGENDLQRSSESIEFTALAAAGGSDSSSRSIGNHADSSEAAHHDPTSGPDLDVEAAEIPTGPAAMTSQQIENQRIVDSEEADNSPHINTLSGDPMGLEEGCDV